MAASLQDLTRAVESEHGVKAMHEGCVHVHEMMDGKTVWEGYVEMFAVEGHSQATRAFAWSWVDEGELRHATALNVPPINSPLEAVRAVIASGRQR